MAVWGDELSGANEIVTGLLDDPLSDDVDQRNMLRQRWASVPQNGAIRIRSVSYYMHYLWLNFLRRNDLASWDGQTLGIKSNWLQNVNAEIIECRGENLIPCVHLRSD